MTRSNFFKSLLGILIAPKAIVEIAGSIEPTHTGSFYDPQVSKSINKFPPEWASKYKWVKGERIGIVYFDQYPAKIKFTNPNT